MGLSGGSDVIPYNQQAAAGAQAAPTAQADFSQLLSRTDGTLYRRIFALQQEGQWEEADRLISRLTDHSLMGHVLYQRYMHPTDYVSSYEELAEWLTHYADHPGDRKSI